MKQFYETYQDDEKFSPLVRELPWTHNTIIFSRCKTTEGREYYIKTSLTEKLTKRELEHQINAAVFERVMLGNQKISEAIKKTHSTTQNIFKDSYVLEFLGLPSFHSERDLQKALIEQMKHFILELGKDFIFFAAQRPLQVGNQDFFVDLLFSIAGFQP